ncbi:MULTISPECIES: hypothetical protein [unclassified Polaribacter]|jgi:hypothetical protein|uniref:hypothetical protein n=1 Tax=unclassified Polaribacter TaxID=196858 RepID=UPI001C4FB2E7|nr:MULTISPECIES: hypothetical protein [unclassified Polaribacter]QXP63216.1 hypothetical protein H0I27_15410 [Polaribacter sp. HaHaR_3_91]QXP65733.1 hypothetical protein H0I28_11030 [Polaribacter sp. AHE13PA]QXP71249.1 hypothetical protein H0I29_03945 [Polaribacter sp. R2A056_3_33]
MKKQLLIFVLVLTNAFAFCQDTNPELAKYVSFLETQNTSAKDYIINLWKKHDIVILCERNHGEMTQYELIYDIVSSDYFKKNVGNIFTEIGSISNQKAVLDFTKTDFTDSKEKEKQLLNLYRKIQWNGWSAANFYYFIDKINTLNFSLPADQKINLFVSDVKDPSKENLSSKENFLTYFNGIYKHRDSAMAENIIHVYDSIKLNSSRKKSLVIMNSRHAFSKTFFENDDKNVGHKLIETYKNDVSNVYLNGLAPTLKVVESDKNETYKDYVQRPIQNGKWDASFKIINKESLGFDFKNSPFGNELFDLFPFIKHNYKYKDIFTGFVFYLPLKRHYEAWGIPNYVDDDFIDEFYKQQKFFSEAIGNGEVLKENLKEDYDYNESKYDDYIIIIEEINKWLEK